MIQFPAPALVSRKPSQGPESQPDNPEHFHCRKSSTFPFLHPQYMFSGFHQLLDEIAKKISQVHHVGMYRDTPQPSYDELFICHIVQTFYMICVIPFEGVFLCCLVFQYMSPLREECIVPLINSKHFSEPFNKNKYFLTFPRVLSLVMWTSMISPLAI